MKMRHLAVILGILFCLAVSFGDGGLAGENKSAGLKSALSYSLADRAGKPTKLLERIEQEKIENYFNKKDAAKYAVLINGRPDKDTEKSFESNLSLAYRVLLENSFKKENIYVLSGSGKNISNCPVDDLASREALTALTRHLGKIVGEKDELFVYVTDHGHRVIKVTEENDENSAPRLVKEWISSINLFNGGIDEDCFAELFKNIKYKTGIFVFVQCYGGGFAKKTGGGNNIAISASREDEVAYIIPFSQEFFEAFQTESADADNDGIITVEEGFFYALENDIYAQVEQEHPQIVYRTGTTRTKL